MNEIESSLFEELTVEHQQSAVSLEIDSSSWDCWINHYNSHFWSDLQAIGIAEHYEILGWDEAMWDDEDGSSNTEELYWDDLSPRQQQAAVSVCYTANAWNLISLTQW